MKKAFIIIGIAIVLITIMIVLCIIILNNKKVKISEIKNFSFSYTQGYMINSSIRYKLEYKDDKYIATVKPYGIPDEEAREIKVSDDFVKEIEEILSKYEVNSWNGFSKSDKYVLDGDSFSCFIDFKNGESVSAHGYMSWPKNYSSVRKELDDKFMSLYNSVY